MLGTVSLLMTMLIFLLMAGGMLMEADVNTPREVVYSMLTIIFLMIILMAIVMATAFLPNKGKAKGKVRETQTENTQALSPTQYTLLGIGAALLLVVAIIRRKR